MDAVKKSLQDGDSKSLLQALKDNENVANLVQDLEDEGIALVQEVCRKGFTSVLEFLIEKGVTLDNLRGKEHHQRVKQFESNQNQTFVWCDQGPNFCKGKRSIGRRQKLIATSRQTVKERALETACRYNQEEIVELLLSHGEPILSEGLMVWQEDSPFYIASRYGHLEVTNVLLAHSPSLVKHEDTRLNLLYAACLGGNVDIIKRWINPGMNINQPLQNVESFTDCEKKTPLYAACSAGHRHVVDFLLENFPELEFTECVCNTFPDIIQDTVVNFFKELPSSSKDEDSLFPLCKGDLNCRKLHILHPVWFELFLPTLVELDISGNYLTELPDCVPWKLQNLRVFRAASNTLKHLSTPDLTCTSDELCPRLEEVDLRHNQLESVCSELFQIESLKYLDLSHNCLKMLFRSIHQIGQLQFSSKDIRNRQSYVDAPKHWRCGNLTKLNVSHNQLVMMPSEISACKSLVTLLASHNKLAAFQAPWDCPLYHLNLSQNELERFPPNADLFWRGSLKYLDISHNQLEEIDECIVKLCVLVDLNISHNKIDRLPRSEIWDLSHLCQLNLKHNRLGAGDEKRERLLLPIRSRSRTSVIEESSQLNFPLCLASCLKELRLSHNCLNYVPPSVCELKSLEILDISHNSIKILPRELGKLKNCGNLKLKGLPMDRYDTSDIRKTKEILSNLLEQLRDCKPCYKMKMIVIGKKDKGKTTLVNLLAGKKNKGVQNRSGVHREEIIVRRRKPSVTLPITFGDKSPDIKFSVWDIEGSEEATLIHHSFFTQNSLYLLVWDFWSIEKELTDIRRWLYNIQATCRSFQVIIVGTFLDKMTVTPEEKLREIEKLNALFWEKLPSMKDSLQLCPVSCANTEGIDKLNTTIYDTACSMKLPGKNKQCLIGRKYPRSYFNVEQLVQEEQQYRNKRKIPPFLSKIEFNKLLEKLPPRDNDISSEEEEEAVTRFLVETGSLLHYSDQLGALNTLFFLDPAWLCDILVKVFTAPFGKVLLTQGRGKVSLKEVVNLYNEDERFPAHLTDQYIKLLERFDIAVPVNNSQMLLFPSKLPDNPPLNIEISPPKNMKKVTRLYRMAELPSGFWTRLLSRMMTRVEQFSRHEWFHSLVIKQSVRKLSGKLTKSGSYRDVHRGKSFRGLKISNVQSTFCREWLKVQYEEGSFCIEPVIFGTNGGECGLPKGVLVTEKSVNEEFSIMGIIVDEIEDIIQDYYPGLLELDDMTMEQRLQRFAICPTCYQQQTPPKELDHFTMEHCARMLLNGDTINCPRGTKHFLSDLIPDMFLKEIPNKFFLEADKLRFQETSKYKLGVGVTGTVFKGTYGYIDIAIKVYRGDIRNTREDALQGSRNYTDGSDSGTGTLSSKGSITAEVEEEDYVNYVRKGVDVDEAESIKAFKALREMRQEVTLTSRLKHPCIVALIGIAFSPKLVMALELAPLGSYRDIIDKHLSKRPEITRFQDKDKLIPPLFSKEITFKFLYQITKGLEYLHCNGIIYKDLKSDNILVMSEDLDAQVNLKLSDYGISKYCWSGGTVGLVGTPGYQAPEILDGLAYDEKVDIFSYAMVVYESLTGRRPYQEFENMSQISKVIKADNKRPSIKDFNVHTEFPYLEDLMEKCWHKEAKERPAATDIVTRHWMQNVQFLALASVNIETDNLGEGIVLGAASHEPGNTTVWMWEGPLAEQRLTLLDLETSKQRQTLEYDGEPVMCMARVGSDIWIGNKDNTIQIFGKHKTKGVLTLVDTFLLSGCPVQMEDISSQEASGQRTFHNVYVALSCSEVCLYQSKNLKVNESKKGSRRTTAGFKSPLTVTLRTKKLFCMGFTKKYEELWVGGSQFIDIIDVNHFKVDKSKTIDLRVLLSYCGLDIRPKIVQIVGADGRAWCLVKNSPYILEFCDQTYNCMSYLNLEEEMLLGKSVRQLLDFGGSDHAEYHATCDTLQRTGNTPTDVESSQSDSEEDYIAPSSWQSIPEDGSPCHDTKNFSPHFQNRKKLTYTRKSSSNPAQRQNDSTDTPPIPERKLPPTIPPKTVNASDIPDVPTVSEIPPLPERRNKTPSVQYRNKVPPVPQRNLIIHQSPENYDNVPPVPQRNQSFAPSPESYDNVPPVPQRNQSIAQSPESNDNIPPVPHRNQSIAQSPENYDNVPAVPQRNQSFAPSPESYDNVPAVPQRNQIIPQSPESNDNGPPVPQRNQIIAQSPESFDNVPPVPQRNQIIPQSPESNDNAPPIPQRHASLRPGASNVVDTSSYGINKIDTRASTLPHRFGSSSSERSSDSRPTSDPPKLPPKSSLSGKYSTDSELDKYNILVDSIVSVGNSVWVGRSNEDICVVDTRLSDDRGKVVAVLKNELTASSSKSQGTTTLLKTGKYVLASYSVTKRGTNGTEIALWDAFDVEDIERIDGHWRKILHIEKKLENDAKTVKMDIGNI